MRSLRSSLVAAFAAAVVIGMPAAAQMQAAPAPATPMVGDMAPDFTAMATDSTGRMIPVSLAGMRGKVVVLAFYPLDRSQGCTVELNKFRDEYSTLFGSGVVVLPVSIDTLASHAGWAHDSHFPFAMIADPKSELATKFGAQGAKYFHRATYVIDRNGRIAYAEPKFGALSQEAYDKLAASIKQAKGE